MIELKRCPFCGGKAILRSWAHVDGIYYTVECPKCYINMGEYESVEEMIKAWNRRCEGTDDPKKANTWERYV